MLYYMVRKIGWLLLLLGVVFTYIYFSGGIYAIDSKYRNRAVSDLVVEGADDPFDRVIDFEKLRGINSDVVGWLYMPDSSVDYPILIGSEDEYYLDRNIYGDYSPLGSIFGFSDVSRDLSDGHVMLFGHNMASNQMFGDLKKFVRSDEFRDSHRKFYVYLDRKVMEFDIFSIFVCDENDSMFAKGRELGSMEYMDFVGDIINRDRYSGYSLEGSSIDISDSQVFSLVTCYGRAGSTERLVVNGAVVREKYIIR